MYLLLGGSPPISNFLDDLIGVGGRPLWRLPFSFFSCRLFIDGLFLWLHGNFSPLFSLSCRSPRSLALSSFPSPQSLGQLFCNPGAQSQPPFLFRCIRILVSHFRSFLVVCKAVCVLSPFFFGGSSSPCSPIILTSVLCA